MILTDDYSDLLGIVWKKKKDPKTAAEVQRDSILQADRQRALLGLSEEPIKTNYVPIIVIMIVVLFGAFLLKKKFSK